MMKRKISLLIVVVMLGVMISGCSGAMSLEEYDKAFNQMSFDYLELKITVEHELDKEMPKVVDGYDAVDLTGYTVAAYEFSEILAEFEQVQPPEELAELHEELLTGYRHYDYNTVAFATAFEERDIEKAREKLEYTIESISEVSDAAEKIRDYLNAELRGM